MGFIHDEQTALNDCPLLIYLDIGGGQALLGNCLCLADYSVSLLLNIGKDLLRLLGTLLDVANICLNGCLCSLEQIAYLCGGISESTGLVDFYFIVVQGGLKLGDFGFQSLDLLLLIMHYHHHFVLGKIH